MLSATQIHSLLVTKLVGAAGGDPFRWGEMIGPVEVLPLATRPNRNWRIEPSAKNAEVDAIDLAVELVRQEHPHAQR
jgi:hypothetical protein